jgi:flagellar biosynthesis protein FlhF
MIKKDLGPDAVVLSTKKIRGPVHPLIEVVAARDVRDVMEASAGGGVEGVEGTFANERDQLGSLKSEIEELKMLIAGAGAFNSVQGELAELKETINAFFDVLGMRRSNAPETGHLARIYYSLLGNGVSKARACTLMETVRKEYTADEIGDYGKSVRIVEDTIAQSFPVPAGKTRPKRIKVFIGPTGVGKTTTLAKLAARYALTEKISVGLITTDTYRIAATEQLKTYAKIIGVPLEVASEKEKFKKSLERFTGKDVILVDTAGKGRSDENYLKRLKDILDVGSPVEANLLLSLASSRENSMDAVSRFGMFDCDQIILTKLDECTRPGFIYDLIGQIGKPVSYVTNGQNVPQDIEKFSPGKLTKLVMGERAH